MLIQFPGKITLEYFNHAKKILERISENERKNRWRKAVGFRLPTWYADETYELLNEHRSTLVLHDTPKSKNIEEIGNNAPFIYYRFHGPKVIIAGVTAMNFYNKNHRSFMNFLIREKMFMHTLIIQLAMPMKTLLI